MIEDTSIFEYFRLRKISSGTMLDVGAHVGSSSSRYAALGWNIYCFEPEPNNFAELSTRLGSYDNVTLEREAVSDEDNSDVQFYVSDEHWGIHTLRPFHSTHRPNHIVKTVRLDTYLIKHSIPRVDFLKIDIEGADFLALQSLDLDAFRPSIVMTEFMDSRTVETYGYSFHDVVEYMAGYKFSCHVFEYSPVIEYAIRGGKNKNRPTFLGAYPFRNDGTPAWGNLVFYSQGDRIFELALKAANDQTRNISLSWLPRPVKNAVRPARNWIRLRFPKGKI